MRDIDILEYLTNLGDSYIFYNTNENEWRHSLTF